MTKNHWGVIKGKQAQQRERFDRGKIRRCEIAQKGNTLTTKGKVKINKQEIQETKAKGKMINSNLRKHKHYYKWSRQMNTWTNTKKHTKMTKMTKIQPNRQQVNDQNRTQMKPTCMGHNTKIENECKAITVLFLPFPGDQSTHFCKEP